MASSDPAPAESSGPARARSVTLHLRTVVDTRAFGEALGRSAVAGDRFLLEGSFGAGKTTFVQGLARGLGVASPVSSPSFVIENVYLGRLTLYHFDLYRLERIDDALLDELEERLFGDGVVAVEWSGALPPQVREGATVLQFAIDAADQSRRVTLVSSEERLLDAALAGGGAWR